MAGKKVKKGKQEEFDADQDIQTKKLKTDDGDVDVDAGNGKAAAEVIAEEPAVKEETKSAVDNGAGDDNSSEKPLADGAEKNGSEIAAADTADNGNAEVDDEDKESGRMVIFGGTNWDLTGRKELPKSAKGAQNNSSGKNLWGPHVWGENIRVRKVISSSTACHSVLITTDGKAMTFGRNDSGQLGLHDTVTRATPELVETLSSIKIVDAAVGKAHTLFLSDQGTVWACGANKMGQLGINSQTQNVNTPTKVQYSGKPIVKVACGAEFSMIVDSFGGLHSFGSPEHGQLGHNSEGKYFTSGNKISFHCETTPRRVVVFIEKSREGHVQPVDDVSIVDVACGVNHAVAVDKKKRVFTWGFAGYGRLGHSETKNELMPRNLKSFDYAKRGAQRVFAGSTFCLALDENGLIYFWGQTKSSGEATMYPKTIPDLCGWNVRDIACANKSILVAADNSLISWGPSPTYGELGYGENKAKSSTTPQEVKILDGIFIRSVSCGYGHTLAIAQDTTQKERDLIDKLPKWP